MDLDMFDARQEAESVTRLLMSNPTNPARPEVVIAVAEYVGNRPKRGIQLMVVLLGNMADSIVSRMPRRDDATLRVQIGGGFFEQETGDRITPGVPHELLEYFWHLLEHRCNGDWEELYDDLFAICDNSSMMKALFAVTIQLYPRVLGASLGDTRIVTKIIDEHGVATVGDEGNPEIPDL